MRTLQEKYNGINEGKFTKDQFLRDARMEQPSLVTKFNGYDDAVKILKNRGMIQETYSTEESFKDYSDDALTDMIINSSRFEGNEESIARVKQELARRKEGIKEDYETVDKTTRYDVTLRNGKHFSGVKFINRNSFNTANGGTYLNQEIDTVTPTDEKLRETVKEARLTNKSLTDYRYKPTNDMDKYPYEQILRGLRVELEGLNILGTPTPEEYKKALAKVLKNLEKDTIFYTNQVAGVSKKVDLHDKMVDVKKDNAVDKFNGLKKAALKEAIKGVIKNILSEGNEFGEGEGVYEMQEAKEDSYYKSELSDYLDDNGIFGYTDRIHSIMTGPDEAENVDELVRFLEDNQIYGYNRGIEAIYADYPYDQHWMNQPDEDEADDIPHPRGYEEASDEEDFDDLFKENKSEDKMSYMEWRSEQGLDEIATDITGFPKWRELGQDEKDHISKFVKDTGDRDEAEMKAKRAERLAAQSARLGAYISGKKDIEEDIFESVSLKDIL